MTLQFAFIFSDSLSSHSECWTAGHTDDIIALLPLWPAWPTPPPAFPSPGKIIPGPFSLCSQVPFCHLLIYIVVLLWILCRRPRRTIAPSCKKCTEASQMRGHKAGAPIPTPRISIFPTLRTAALALCWEAHLLPFRPFAGWLADWPTQRTKSTWESEAEMVTCCDIFGSASGSPCEREVHAFRGRQLEVNGKLPFGVVTNHEMLGELTLLDPLGLIWAKCQLSRANNWKNQMSRMEETLVLKRNNIQKKIIFFLF